MRLEAVLLVQVGWKDLLCSSSHHNMPALEGDSSIATDAFGDPVAVGRSLDVTQLNGFVVSVEDLLSISGVNVVQHSVSSEAHEGSDQLKRSSLLSVPQHRLDYFGLRGEASKLRHEESLFFRSDGSRLHESMLLSLIGLLLVHKTSSEHVVTGSMETGLLLQLLIGDYRFGDVGWFGISEDFEEA